MLIFMTKVWLIRKTINQKLQINLTDGSDERNSEAMINKTKRRPCIKAEHKPLED